jgi:hypothetical protein
MSARMTILALAVSAWAIAFALAGCAAASAACGSSIAEFETIISSDVETGNLNKGVHRRIVAELASVKASCTAGRDAEASRALAALKARHGYR